MVPTSWFPKDRLVGRRVTLAVVSPAPERGMRSWPPEMLASIWRTPVRVPEAEGAKLTLKVQVVPLRTVWATQVSDSR